MKRSTKGFYTLEAAMILPIVILAIISLGYFMKIEGSQENCMHGALDESTLIASRAYDGGTAARLPGNIKSRISRENPSLDELQIKNVMYDYSDGITDELYSFTLTTRQSFNMPFDFGRIFEFEGRVKFRGFVGKKIKDSPLGSDGLESESDGKSVWIFPYSGDKYHAENCTYVKASVAQRILDSSVRAGYSSCSACDSGELSTGSIVFCFKGENTAYHRGTCRTIDRRTSVIDKDEAEEKGYSPCSKCGGG